MASPQLPPSADGEQDPKRFQVQSVWQFLTWVIAPLLIGIAGVSMAKISGICYEINTWIIARAGWGPLVYMPIGYAFLIYASRKFFPGTGGSGIPQAIAVLADEEDQKKSNLLSIRIVIGRVLLLIGGLVIGASVGHEGPMVQIGGSLMHAFFGYSTLKTSEQRQMLVLAGGAAGVAATFNAPLGGMMFAMEEMAKKYVFKGHNRMILTVLLSGLVSLLIMGSYTYFGRYHIDLAFWHHVPAILICGAVGGVFGGLFSMAAQKTPDALPTNIRRFLVHHPMAFAAICGFIVACLSLATDGAINGTGYVPTKMALESDGPTHVWFYGLSKFIATLLSALSGLPGGLFAPTLSVGGGLGDLVSHVVPDIAPHQAVIILVMVAYLAGLTQSPLTAFMVTMEITGSYELLLPMIAVSLIANFVSVLVCPTSFYHKLALRFEKKPEIKEKETAPAVEAKEGADAGSVAPIQQNEAAEDDISEPKKTDKDTVSPS